MRVIFFTLDTSQRSKKPLKLERHSNVLFNGDLSTWDVSSVVDMSYMFNYASTFNTSLSTWDVSSVKDMSYMFSYAYQFSRDVSSWTGPAATTPQTNMFLGATAFQVAFTCTSSDNGPSSSCVCASSAC
jgi:hypothetical protein